MGKMDWTPPATLFPAPVGEAIGPTSPRKGRRMRYLLLGSILVFTGGVWACWTWLRPAPPLAEGEEFYDDQKPLPEAEAFLRLLLDHQPVEALEKCLARYQREVRHGMTATLVKKERIYGQPPPPQEPVQEVIDLAVRGDVPDESGRTHIQVRMIWREGARQVLGSPVRGVLFVEEQGGGKDKILTYRPQALLRPEHYIALNDVSARSSSRYCVRDAGLYRGMLRTYTVWKQRQQAGRLQVHYLATEAVDFLDGRVCHILERKLSGTGSRSLRDWRPSQPPTRRSTRRFGRRSRAHLPRCRTLVATRQRIVPRRWPPPCQLLLPQRQS
ncbi:MAG: hypothetical protein KatS3mg106_209 [Gemmataceae bacterium]|nr:MAG: hypothetical protein KatS3mg106_209 [Gemmataceae bacterium]